MTAQHRDDGSSTLEFIMAYEAGETDEDETIKGFQQLIDSGLAWQLQGSYGRLAETLIQQGVCRRHFNA